MKTKFKVKSKKALATALTIHEGKKVSVNVAQVMEILSTMTMMLRTKEIAMRDLQRILK